MHSPDHPRGSPVTLGLAGDALVTAVLIEFHKHFWRKLE